MSASMHTTRQVKGDDAEEAVETHAEESERLEQAAFESGLTEELLRNNDVVRQQVKDTSDTFINDSVQVVEESAGLLSLTLAQPRATQRRTTSPRATQHRTLQMRTMMSRKRATARAARQMERTRKR